MNRGSESESDSVIVIADSVEVHKQWHGETLYAREGGMISRDGGWRYFLKFAMVTMSLPQQPQNSFSSNRPKNNLNNVTECVSVRNV